MIGPYYYWPESSGLGNVANFYLETPMALPPKNFLHFLLNRAFLSQNLFCGNAIGNVANQKSATLPRPDHSGHYLTNTNIMLSSFKRNYLDEQTVSTDTP